MLVAIGRYHPGAPAGAPTEDYSVRTARDRRGLTDDASALDIGAGWPNGGRAAWLRYNNLLVAALRAGEPELGAVRATNYSPDGTGARRVDRERGFAVENSTDSVTTHTHHEFYRDTAGRRQACLDRLAGLIAQAVNPSTHTRRADKVLTLFQIKNAPAVYVSDGIQCRWVRTSRELAQLRNWGLNHWGNLFNRGEIVEVTPEDFDALAGVLIGPDPTVG